MGIINVDFDATGQLLIAYSGLSNTSEKEWEYNEAVHQLFIDFKRACDLHKSEVLYNIFIEFGIQM
jgi:hypothetical protein